MKTLKAARALYKRGFAVIWLHPKSKRPVESGWTTGERKPWVYLESTYREGYNVGVRTGTPSKIDGMYLACIDVDIKNPEYRAKALASLKVLVGDKVCPEVRSGSGHGSRHLYCLTPEPFKMITVEKHPDWEICVYSDGRQMVLPPSIHPDSGKEYVWKTSWEDAPLPTMEFERPASHAPKSAKPIGDTTTTYFKFEPEPVMLECLDISKSILEGIKNGTGVSDRSSFLFTCSMALVSAGATENEVLSVLTDTRYYIGSCAFEHAQTSDRARAAQWVHRYTLKKVSTERDPTQVFTKVGDGVELAVRVLSPAEIEAQTTELMEGAWKSEENGFYYRGKKGALIPDYKALLDHFSEAQPFKTIADMKAVYTFNGTHYVDCTPIEIKAFAEVNFCPDPEEKIRAEFYSKILANNVNRRNFFTDSTEGKVNFKNGVLDLNVSDTELMDHSPEFGFRGVLPYDFDPFATCPVFKEWLSGIMLDDDELIAVLQEFMGYVVRGGDYKYHKALWLGGVGRNGKSTFVDLLKALIGIGNFSVLSIKGLMTDKFAGADLDGKIANFSEETSPQELADSGPFKNLTGDGDIFAQKKYGDPYSFRNRAKLIMTYNQIPDLKDLSPGMLSRPLIVPFLKVIGEGEQDRGIKKKLFAELSGIFNFALDGWRRLELQEGFSKSEKSDTALQKIKEESCNVFQWVENHISMNGERPPGSPKPEFGSEGTYRANDLYSLYSRHEKFTFKAPEFYRRLNAHPGVKNRRVKGEDFNYYWGLKFRG